jgi:hypothetical protein
VRVVSCRIRYAHINWLLLIATANALMYRYTTVQNASVFSATTPLMLVLYKAARGGGVTVPEGIGVATAVVGSTLIRFYLLICRIVILCST